MLYIWNGRCHKGCIYYNRSYLHSRFHNLLHNFLRNSRPIDPIWVGLALQWFIISGFWAVVVGFVGEVGSSSFRLTLVVFAIRAAVATFSHLTIIIRYDLIKAVLVQLKLVKLFN